MSNKKHDIREIIIKVMAVIMAILMVVAVSGTLIYCLLRY